jgi:hypothetical protein
VLGIPLAIALRWLCKALGLALLDMLLAARLNGAAVVVAVIPAYLAAAFTTGVILNAERRFTGPFCARLALAALAGTLAALGSVSAR